MVQDVTDVSMMKAQKCTSPPQIHMRDIGEKRRKNEWMPVESCNAGGDVRGEVYGGSEVKVGNGNGEAVND